MATSTHSSPCNNSITRCRPSNLTSSAELLFSCTRLPSARENPLRSPTSVCRSAIHTGRRSTLIQPHTSTPTKASA
ncbi:Replicative superfamily II helicase [Pseudomonas syringae pv. actinidiae]|uniref:Replicative superfamily II helicase n=1 Tax=Pseudomonas syringae pv. actinidiae TaxID=103796 RepID=A0A2V0QPJ0_PSESF|nr:Replicative superfamily II helicase [Pseudomonas syringae pv. actinidiae]